MDDTDDDADEGFESGPFCRHWSDPGTCDEKCASCDHTCAEHNDEGTCEECDCKVWKDS